MSRIQFSVTDAEYKVLEQLSINKGYPNTSFYCKDVALQKRTYANLWKEVVNKINKMPKGNKFALRDLISTPPANMGVALYKNQNQLNICINPHKDNWNTNTYIKI